MTPYVATITTDKYAACYKDGGMIVVRLKDGASAVLGITQTHDFHRMIREVSYRTTLFEAVNDAFDGRHYERRKWIVVRPGRTVIEIYNSPIGEKL